MEFKYKIILIRIFILILTYFLILSILILSIYYFLNIIFQKKTLDYAFRY